MKNILLIIILLAFVACNNAEKDANAEKQVGFEVEYLEGYFPKNDIQFNAPVKTLIINKKEDFDKYFGIAQTMKNQVPTIDFDKNKVVAIISAPSDKKQEILIPSADLKKNRLVVKYKVMADKVTQSFTSTDLKMFLIPKSVYAIDFIIDSDEPETSKKEKP
ncbi:hypothetical protein [Aequorivita capsosiphonis]|uniref:hypothetical protein n=1 Tax=Aequorivita capsosiphonis TaxID=487317 RepID=UPI0004102ABE|nr:hypothetical protein [Aequorivita capsosiphonis]